jgi:hypothetical protein
MRNWIRTSSKWGLRSLTLLLAIATVYVVTLIFPYPLFAHQGDFGEFKVYSSQPLPIDLDQTIEDVRSRVKAMEYARPGARCNVFICGDQRLYSFFAFLTRMSPNSLAIGLSAVGNVYMNAERVRRFAAQNSWGIRHSRSEGNTAEVIAHEIAHFNVVKAKGYRASRSLPVWKSEGYAEYQANLAVTRADTLYVFSDRIELLLNAPWDEGSVARWHFEWQLLVEFLGEVKGYGLEDLMDTGLTEEAARREMLEWYAEQQQAG